MSSDLATIIRSLADGAAVDSDALRTALEGDADAADALVHLGRSLATLRQRGAELRAVMSSTRDLLSVTDPDLMLQRIVDRAHELMEVDVAYLSVYEPVQDELYVRAETGTISPRFLGMVVPAGVGLASVAVHTQHPQWVEDYSTLTSVPHDPTIDAIMREEQLRSLLGAPLVVNGRVLGVLFAASRVPHAFRPDEVALLSAFAGHAALALHQAQLLRDATEATAEAASRQRDVEWAAGLHDALTRLVVDGHGAEAIVDALAEALGRQVALAGDEDLPADPVVRRAATDAAQSGRSVMVAHPRIELVAAVLGAGTRSSTFLVAGGERMLTQIERRTVERAALMAALVRLRLDALDDAEERVRGELATELLEGPTNRASGIRRAATRNYAIHDPWVTIVLPCAAGDRTRLVARLRSHTDWLVATSPHGVTVLAPLGAQPAQSSPVAVARVVQEICADAAPFALATGSTTLDAAAAEAPNSWHVAALARGLGISSGVLDAVSLSPYALLFGGDGAALANFVGSMLSPVLRWDQTHGSVLVDTLAALFDERWSLAATARTLHIHLNTLKQRIQRMQMLLGDELNQPETRFRLELAVRVERARRAAEQTLHID
ncbi:helix-turn-helix domain-containing protein [Microbacterium sp. A94]|uniref:helix-turn-helix domain-containing protein n=1 Tax=Microbacterium sp. A94 TaxID=3450717 RepID=UPI003F42927E